MTKDVILYAIDEGPEIHLMFHHGFSIYAGHHRSRSNITHRLSCRFDCVPGPFKNVPTTLWSNIHDGVNRYSGSQWPLLSLVHPLPSQMFFNEQGGFPMANCPVTSTVLATTTA